MARPLTDITLPNSLRSLKLSKQILLLFLMISLLCCSDAHAQLDLGPDITEVTPSEATDGFIDLFETTCFRHRNTPDELRAIAVREGWHELPGPFPYREKGMTGETQIAWSLRWKGIPHHVGLTILDDVPSSISCGVLSYVIGKDTLSDQITKRLGMTVRRKFEQGDHIYILLDYPNDEHVRTVCSYPKVHEVMMASCSIVVAN